MMHKKYINLDNKGMYIMSFFILICVLLFAPIGFSARVIACGENKPAVKIFLLRYELFSGEIDTDKIDLALPAKVLVAIKKSEIIKLVNIKKISLSATVPIERLIVSSLLFGAIKAFFGIVQCVAREKRAENIFADVKYTTGSEFNVVFCSIINISLSDIITAAALLVVKTAQV